MARRVNQELVEELLMFASKVTRIQERFLEDSDCGLSYRPYRQLIRIAEGKNTLKKQGATATITYSAMSQAMATLISKGFVTQARTSKDKREVLHTITPEGRAAKAAASKALNRFVAQLIAGLDDVAVDELQSSLKCILTNLEQVADDLGLRPESRIAKSQKTMAQLSR